MSINALTGELNSNGQGDSAPYGMVQIAGKFLVNNDELKSGVSNRYGHHKKLVRKSQIRDKIKMFLAPQEKRREIPKQPKKENAKQLENIPLNKTFVAFLNERGSIGHIIPQVTAIYVTNFILEQNRERYEESPV